MALCWARYGSSLPHRISLPEYNAVECNLIPPILPPFVSHRCTLSDLVHLLVQTKSFLHSFEVVFHERFMEEDSFCFHDDILCYFKKSLCCWSVAPLRDQQSLTVNKRQFLPRICHCCVEVGNNSNRSSIGRNITYNYQKRCLDRLGSK